MFKPLKYIGNMTEGEIEAQIKLCCRMKELSGFNSKVAQQYWTVNLCRFQAEKARRNEKANQKKS